MSAESYPTRTCELAAFPPPGPAQGLPAVHLSVPPFTAQQHPAVCMGPALSPSHLVMDTWTVCSSGCRGQCGEGHSCT